MGVSGKGNIKGPKAKVIARRQYLITSSFLEFQAFPKSNLVLENKPNKVSIFIWILHFWWLPELEKFWNKTKKDKKLCF